MAHLASFVSAKFDVSKETPNPINPIAGESVLIWLQQKLTQAGYYCDLPESEDWGWYTYAGRDSAEYLIGASADVDISAYSPETDVDWIVQLHKMRSFKDKLFSRNKLKRDDALFNCIVEILRADGEMKQVTVDWDA